jgi:uncharacterized protein
MLITHTTDMKTLVGVKRIAFFMPDSASLKDKRQVIRKLKDKITSRFNVSFAEIDNDDKWQRSVVVVSMVSNTKDLISSAFQQIGNQIESMAEIRVFNESQEIFCYEDEVDDAI